MGFKFHFFIPESGFETCFSCDPRHQTTGARVLVATPGTKPQTHVFWLRPPAPKVLEAKRISNADVAPFPF